MDALSRVHGALVPDGILLDLMPFEPWVPVETAEGTRLAHLDCREFARGARAAQAGRAAGAGSRRRRWYRR